LIKVAFGDTTRNYQPVKAQAIPLQGRLRDKIRRSVE